MVITLALLAAPCIAQPPSPAQTITEFDLPAQRLDEALRQVAEQLNLQILFTPKAVHGITAPSLRGRFTAQQAINRLLRGSGLTQTFDGENTFVIRAAAPPGGTPRENPKPLAPAPTAADASGTVSKGLEDIIVTAQRREENIQNTPISMAAFDPEALNKIGIVNVMDIDKIVSNVVLTPFPANRTAANTYIRGVGSIDVQITKDPAVGIYLDGVYLGRALDLAMDIADLERIEILRGPQGTLYGRNTTGGAINIVSATPEHAPKLKQRVSVGNRGYWRSQTMLNLPVTDTLAARLAYMVSEKNGWVKNLGPGPDFQEDEKESGRLALRWTPSDAFSADYAYDTSRVNGGVNAYQIASAVPVANGRPNPYYPYVRENRLGTLSVVGETGLDTKVGGHALTLAWDVSDQLTLKSITAYRELDSSATHDVSGSVNYLNRVGPPAAPVRALLPLGSEINGYTRFDEQNQFSQEFQAIGDALEGRLEYVAGLYYFYERGMEENTGARNNVIALNAQPLGANYAFLPPALQATYDQLELITWSGYRTDAKAKSLAAYTQFTYNPAILEDRLKVMVGARFTKDEREAVKYNYSYDPGFIDLANTGELIDNWRERGDATSSRFTPALTLAYDLADGVNVYAKYSRAYRAAGFNTRAPRETFANGFGPEDLTAYEIGVKSDLLDNRLRLNAAAFHYDYENQQVDQNIPGNISATTTVNAGKSALDGFELDITALLLDELTLTASYGYLDAQFKEFRDTLSCANVPAPLGSTVDVSDCRHVPASPRQSYTVALDYVFPALPFGELSARVQYHHEEESFFSAKGAARRDAFGLLDASLQLAMVRAGPGELRFQLWGKNLENKEYELHVTDFGNFTLATFNEPRSYGLDVTYEF